MSRHGIIRNRLTKQPVQRSGPKEDDPHVYVRLVLAETGKQKRLAVKHVVAHVWRRDAGYRLEPGGWPANSKNVSLANGDPHDCSASNIVVTANVGTPRRKRARSGQAVVQRQQVASNLTTSQQMRQAAGVDVGAEGVAGVAGGGGCNTAMSWPTGYNSAGRLLGSLSPEF